MHRLLVVAAATLLAGCAAGMTTANGPRQVVIQSGDLKTFTAFTFSVTPEDRVVSTSVAAPADRVWAAVEQAYQGLGLAVTRLDAAHHVIGSQPSLAGHRLAGQPLSAFLDCGVNAARAPIVNTYTVTLALTTQVSATGDSSRVETLVQARAQDPVHNNPAVSCTSTGKLESTLGGAVLARAGT
jgi:hypothetical protein